MADEQVVAVKFLNSVRFNMTENSTLMPERDKCLVSRVAGGIEARSTKGRIFVPYSNVAYIQFAVEQPKGNA